MWSLRDINFKYTRNTVKIYLHCATANKWKMKLSIGWLKLFHTGTLLGMKISLVLGLCCNCIGLYTLFFYSLTLLAIACIVRLCVLCVRIVQWRIQDLGLGGGNSAQDFGNRRGTRGGSREGSTPSWVRGPGQSLGNFWISRSLYVSCSVFWQYKWLQNFWEFCSLNLLKIIVILKWSSYANLGMLRASLHGESV